MKPQIKTVVSISLGDSKDNYDFHTRFLQQEFRVIRVGVEGDIEAAESLISWKACAASNGWAPSNSSNG